MPLPTGTRLGVHGVSILVGSGGMGLRVTRGR